MLYHQPVSTRLTHQCLPSAHYMYGLDGMDTRIDYYIIEVLRHNFRVRNAIEMPAKSKAYQHYYEYYFALFASVNG